MAETRFTGKNIEMSEPGAPGSTLRRAHHLPLKSSCYGIEPGAHRPSACAIAGRVGGEFRAPRSTDRVASFEASIERVQTGHKVTDSPR